MHMLYVYVFMSICISIQKTKLVKNGNFRSFAANGKREWQTSVCLLQTEMENGSLFSLLANDKMVIDDCCFSKCAHLCSFNQKNNHSIRFSKFYISIHSFGNFIGVKQVWSYLGDIY
jgi:hypothetical protein